MPREGTARGGLSLPTCRPIGGGIFLNTFSLPRFPQLCKVDQNKPRKQPQPKPNQHNKKQNFLTFPETVSLLKGCTWQCRKKKKNGLQEEQKWQRPLSFHLLLSPISFRSTLVLVHGLLQLSLWPLVSEGLSVVQNAMALSRRYAWFSSFRATCSLTAPGDPTVPQR